MKKDRLIYTLLHIQILSPPIDFSSVFPIYRAYFRLVTTMDSRSSRSFISASIC